MTLKLVLISPSGTLVDDQKVLRKSLIQEMSGFIARMQEHGVHVAIWSNHRWTVDKEPLEQFFTRLSRTTVRAFGMQVNGLPARRCADSVMPILESYGVQRNETILVGTEEEDVWAGVNNALLLVRPSWYPNDTEYGFAVSSFAELERFCVVFGVRQHPIYWSIRTGSLNALAMGPYSTRLQQYRNFGEDAFQSAKFEKGTLEFWHRLLVSSLYFSGLVGSFHYIATYPGHSSDARPRAIEEVMMLLGKCLRKTFYPDLIVRHSTAVKSAYAGPGQRTFANQVNTIQLNKYPRKWGVEPRKTPLSLKGKTVLIVDDICTNGRSLEAARLYIEAAGGRAVLFSWLKTINTDFYELTDRPAIKPFERNTIRHEPGHRAHGYQTNIVDPEAPGELATLLEEFNAWDLGPVPADF